jgi:hypothetical protein
MRGVRPWAVLGQAPAGQRQRGQRDRGLGPQGRGRGRVHWQGRGQQRGQLLPPRDLGLGALHLQRAEDQDLVPEQLLPLGNFETETAQGRGRGSALKEAGAGADCLRVEPDYSPGWGQPLVLGPQMLALIVLQVGSQHQWWLNPGELL